LKVTPVAGVGKALKSKKLSPKFIGPYQILKQIGSIAYQIALPPNLSNFIMSFMCLNFVNIFMTLFM